MNIALLIVVPLIIGFVGERYKDSQTWLFGLFLIVLFCGIEFFICMTAHAKMFEAPVCNLLYLGGIVSGVGLFHLQKRARHKAKRIKISD